MVTLNPNTVIEDSLVMAFGLRSYIDILSVIQRDNFVATPEFRKAFNGFYRVRQVFSDRKSILLHIIFAVSICSCAI